MRIGHLRIFVNNPNKSFLFMLNYFKDMSGPGWLFFHPYYFWPTCEGSRTSGWLHFSKQYSLDMKQNKAMAESEVYNAIVRLLEQHDFRKKVNGDMIRENTGCLFYRSSLMEYKTVVDFQLHYPYYA